MPPVPVQRHALITGGGRGIGIAIARGLHDAGWMVSIIGRDGAALEAAMAAGAADFCATADVTDDAGLAAAIATLAARAPITAAIANAGGAELARFERADIAQFQRLFDLNTLGMVRVFQSVLPDMRKRGHGRLVAITSTAAHRGYSQASAYVAAKHAMRGIVSCLALELAGSGVTVNAVSPGYTDTDLVGRAVAAIAARNGVPLEAARARFESDNPAGRLVRPEEVAEAVRFLCESEGDSLSGQAIRINGGEF